MEFMKSFIKSKADRLNSNTVLKEQQKVQEHIYDPYSFLNRSYVPVKSPNLEFPNDRSEAAPSRKLALKKVQKIKNFYSKKY